MILSSRQNFNFIILAGATFAIMVLGIIILASVSAPRALEAFDTPYYYLKHQLTFGLIPGLILMFVLLKINFNWIKKWIFALLLLNLLLMAMVFLPKIGEGAGGATRWLNLGPFSFQPSEFLKLTAIVYLASWLSVRTEKMKSEYRSKNISQTFFAFAVIVGALSLLLILQPDIGTLSIIVLAALMMYFCARTPIWHSFLFLTAGSVALALLVKFAPYRMNRFMVFLNPNFDLQGIGYQLKHAVIAAGSGGMWGVGLGMSSQKFGLLPQPMADSIFAIFAEEAGFLGVFILILFLSVFMWACFRIVRACQNRFFQLAALGISSWLLLQSFINMGSVIGVLPLTGVPLPFVSYGGSALAAELAGVGILLNIAKNK